MNTRELNQNALRLLGEQDWYSAQRCFFENARRFPSHESHNNLGYFLVTEGLTYRDGRSRNAFTTGLRHILKAAEYRKSAENYFALGTAIYYSHRGRFTNPLGVCTYRHGYEAMAESVRLKYSHEAEFDRLRFLYLCDSQSPSLVPALTALTEQYKTLESAEFYLTVLCLQKHYEQCLQSIPLFMPYLGAGDLFVLYFLCGQYEKAAAFFDEINRHIFLGIDGSAMMVECLIRTGRQADLARYAEKTMDSINEWSGSNSREARAFQNLFLTSAASMDYRRRLIADYKFEPRFLPDCCYFGCEEHNTSSFL